MNLSKNYYSILGVNNISDEKSIKKAYYKLSFTNHPDKGGDHIIFSEMTEAYDVLCSEQLFDIKIDFDYQKEKTNLDNFKKNEVLDIYMNIDETFDGTLEYERWVKCKTCDGTGKDLSAKIVIKDNDGNVLRTFDADDGCDFCEGSGKDYKGDSCNFCNGKGKIGLTPCKKCNGEKRILGKQKLSGVKLTGNETKIESMGNCSKDVAGMVGYLLLKKS